MSCKKDENEEKACCSPKEDLNKAAKADRCTPAGAGCCPAEVPKEKKECGGCCPPPKPQGGGCCA